MLVSLAIVLISVRAYGIRPLNTKTVSVHIVGGATAEDAQKDAATIAAASGTACKPPPGWFAKLLDERGPSSVVVIASGDFGSQRRIAIDCGTGHVVKTT